MLEHCLTRKLHPEASLRRKLLESRTAFDLVCALQSLGDVDSDRLVLCVIRAYLYVPPSESEMQFLSRQHQLHNGHGNAAEYASLTAFLGASEALMRVETTYTQIKEHLMRLKTVVDRLDDRNRQSLSRTRSCPNLSEPFLCSSAMRNKKAATRSA